MICFRQCFDHADTLGVFPHDGNHPVLRPLYLGEHRNALGGFRINQKCDKRQCRQHHQRQHRLHNQRNHNPADQQNRRADPHPLNHADHPVNVVGIAGQTAFQGWYCKFIPFAAGQPDRFLKQIVPDMNGRIPGDAGREPVRFDVKNPARNGYGDHDQAIDNNQLNVLGRHDCVDHIRQQIGQQQHRQRSQRLHQKADGHRF